MSLRGVLGDTIGTGGGLFQGAALPQSAVRPSGLFGVGTDFQAGHHEIHECVPTGKEPITGERAQIIEESLAGGQMGADQPIVPIGDGESSAKSNNIFALERRHFPPRWLRSPRFTRNRAANPIVRIAGD